ncbi:WD repeat-containing protein 91 [Bulinus truncatus]|nr:WD repeat-containing protein 91 [Bulinus truncatus]
MAASCEKLDQLVKDYLLFRGFSSALKTLDQEIKNDKDKGLRVDRMMEQIWTYLASFDLQALREYWRYLNYRLFSRLEQRYALSVRRLESSLFKLYIVNAHQGGRQEKVLGFFEQLGPELQSHPDFKDWFAFPFVANPAENPMFSLYFIPTLLNVEFDARRMKTLQEENTSLKQQLMNSATVATDSGVEIKIKTRQALHSELPPPASPPDMVYDFSGLVSDSDASNSEKQKTTRRFPLSLTSPLMGRKKTEVPHSKAKTTASLTTATASTVSAVTGAQGKQSKVPETSSIQPSTSSATDGRKMSVPTSLSSIVTGPTETSKSQASNRILVQHQSSLIRHATFTAGDTQAVTSNVTNRSLSVPNSKLPFASKKVTEMVKRKSEGQLSSISDGGGEITSPSSVMDTMSDNALETDSDCPFLLLEVDEYVEHSSAAAFCRFSLSGQYVASLDVDGIVKVWMWSPQPATTATVMSRSAFLSLAWASKSDRWLLLGNKTGSIRLFDVKESKTFKEVLVNPDNPSNCMRVTDVSTSPLGIQFTCATADYCPFTSNLANVTGRLLLWDLRTLKLERALPVESNVCNAITCSTYSRNSQTLLTGGADGYLRLYDLNTQKPVQKWPAHEQPIHTVLFHADKSVYSMSADGKLCEWSLSRPGQMVNLLNCGARDSLANKPGSCRGRLFALDMDREQYLLTYNAKRGTIYRIQDVSSPTRAMDLKLHQSPVVSVDWSSSQDTGVCLTSSADAKIKISTLLSK